MGPAINRGEVWWVDVPDDKVRPAIVLTRQRIVGRLNKVLVAPISTRARGIPTEVALGKADGLTRPCVANFDNLKTVPKARFRQRITQLGSERMGEVCWAYRFAAGC